MIQLLISNNLIQSIWDCKVDVANQTVQVYKTILFKIIQDQYWEPQEINFFQIIYTSQTEL